MKKYMFMITFFVLLIIAIMLIPNMVMAETIETIEFDYSKIKAVGGETPKLYEIDPNVGEILSQGWTDAEGGTVTEFVTGNAYIYNAKIKFNDEVNVNITNPPSLYESYGTEIDSVDGTIIYIEFKITVPKAYTITINAPESVHLDVANKFTTYEMARETINFTLDEGCEIVEIKANGIQIGGDVYIDDNTWLRYLDDTDEMEINNITTDVEIDIKATISKKQTINLIGEVPKVGDSPQDFKVKLDSTEYSLLYAQWYEIIEDELEVIEIEGEFEAGKMYGLELGLEGNILGLANNLTICWNDKEIKVTYLHGNMYAGFYFEELEEKEEIKDEENNEIADKDDKDYTPKTGYNGNVNNSPVLFMGILAIISVAIVVTTKLKK